MTTPRFDRDAVESVLRAMQHYDDAWHKELDEFLAADGAGSPGRAVSTAVLEAPPDEELRLPPAYRQVRPQTGLSSTHLLAGGGGDTLGLWEAGFLPLYAGNHEPVCIESHVTNWARLG